MTVRVRLACLDMAGTTVNDGGIVEECFARAMEEVGLSGDAVSGNMDHVHRTMGLPKETVFRSILHDEGLVVAAVSAFDTAMHAAVKAGKVTEVPGAAKSMTDMREAGVAVCLTTGFTGEVQAAIIQHLGWLDTVDLALCPSETLRGRPYPDLVLAAVLRLGIDDVAEVAVVGDTTNDLLCGTRAGASIVVAVLTGEHRREELEAVPHTHIVDSIADVPALLL